MILVLSDLWVPFPGGAERLMFNLARDLMRRGHGVTVLTGYRDAVPFDGPPVTQMPIGVGRTHGFGAGIVKRAIGRVRPDVILTHHLYAYEFEAELAASDVPVVQVVLNTRRCDGIAFAVFISEWVRDRVGGQPGDMVITPPVFDDVVAPTHGDAIGFIKPLPHKGVELFYRIAAAFPARPFLVLRGEWQEMETIRPAPNITFMEPVADIRDFYTRCRVVLMPSLSEDAGTVAQECALNGIPCLTSNVEGLAETGGGIRLPPDSLQLWCAAIVRLDAPDVYAATVTRQREHLAASGQDERLDEFAARVGALYG